MITRPMLAATPPEFDVTTIKFPCFVQPKFDGIRCVRHRKLGPVSRTFKDIPNRHIQRKMASELITGDFDLDGELVVGEQFHQSTSGIMSRDGEPDFTYHIFDIVTTTNVPYVQRFTWLTALNTGTLNIKLPSWVKIVSTLLVESATELEVLEEKLVQAGYEGAIARSPSGIYKCGRSTMNEQFLVKFKRFRDREATVIGFEELMVNQNAPTQDAFGLTERSSHKANLVPGGMLGALVVRDEEFGTFNIGTGFTEADRMAIWMDKQAYLGKKITYKYQPHGTKDKPRIPVFKVFRLD